VLARGCGARAGGVGAAGAEFVIEHPQRRYVQGRRAFWREHADVATPGDLPELLALEVETGAVRVDFAQCACGGRYQKFSTLLCSPRIGRMLGELAGRRCARCDAFSQHEERAVGRFADGSSRAAAAAAYPSELCRAIASAGLACAREGRRAPSRPLDGAGEDSDASDDEGLPGLLADSSGDEEDGPMLCGACDADPEARTRTHSATAPSAAETRDGRVASGAGLSATVAAAVEAARARPPKYASLRNLAAAASAELRATAMPHVQPVQSERQPAPRNGVPPPAGRGGRPAGMVSLAQLFLPGVFERVREWQLAAGAAMRDMAAGRAVHPPATLIVTQGELQPWARGVIWDCRTPGDCAPVVPSARDTPDVCAQRVRRDRVRAAAGEMGWADHDLLGQVGEGGFESRSECSLDMVLAFHHLGAIEHFEAAHRIISGDVADGSVLGPFNATPFVPMRCLPRNVIWQARSRVLPSGEIEDYDKPRVTTNSSFGEGEVGSDGRPLAVNEAVPQDERFIVLPTVRQLGRGAAIVAEAGAADGLQAEAYCFDLKSAYRFTSIQRLDWWQHCFLWIGADGTVGYFTDPSGAFGGAYMPQRFERLTMLGAALARRRQDEFDAAHPYPAGVGRWVAERAGRRAGGGLPGGDEQLRPGYLHIYIDDGGGAALNDSVPVPPELQSIPLGERATRALGGVPSAFDSRAAVHLRIAIAVFEWLGFVVEHTKTECGSAVVSLGFRVHIAGRRIDCPLGKRSVMLRDVAALRAAAAAPPFRVEQAPTERLTGRLGNLSQALPELTPYLVGGYAVATARLPPRRGGGGATGGGPGRRRLGEVQLRRGSRCQRAVVQLCDVAEALLEGNEGIPLASEERFAALGDAGVLTTVSDASGEDGVGGYAFHPAAPGVVWLLADEWPPDVREALAVAAMRRAERPAGAAACSMPLAELFGPWALAAAVCVAWPTRAVISIVDCAPAAAALTAATSAGAQLRELVRAARGTAQQWLAVAVPREANIDADILSHPARWEEVRAAAELGGLRVMRVHAPAECWRALRAAIQLPMGREAEGWREAGELTATGGRRRRRGAG